MTTFFAAACLVFAAANVDTPVYFQAHRGGMDEVPENTMAALRHAWSIPGAVPEIDLRTTRDGHIVCIHDETPARTTMGPDALRQRPVRELTLEELQRLDAGQAFDPAYAGERVPRLEDVFEEMALDSARFIYLDLKDVDIEVLATHIENFAVIERILFVHGDPAMCATLRQRFPGTRTMTWLSGAPRNIKQRFAILAQDGFNGISQLQFHLRGQESDDGIEYILDAAFLAEAVSVTRAAGVDLQVRPFVFDPPALAGLMALGIQWYVADAPRAFHEALTEGRTLAAPAAEPISLR